MSVRKFVWLLLFLWAMVCSACSVDVVAETSPVDQDGPVNVTTSTSVPEVSSTEIGPTVVSSMVTTTVAMLDLSPAWIEAKEVIRRLDTTESSSDAEWEELMAEQLAVSRFYDRYILENTNSISSSPMGALCWVYQELSRTHELYLSRLYADKTAEIIIGASGIVDENYDNQGPVDFLLDYLTSDITVDNNDNSGPVGVINEDNGVKPDMSYFENSIEEDEWRILTFYPFLVLVMATGFGLKDEWTKEDFLTAYRDPRMTNLIQGILQVAGDGTEWAPAVRSVVKSEVRAAVRVGEGLSPEVQLYADALFRAVQDYIDSGQTEPSRFYEDLPGFHDFVEVAKYSSDCKRLSIAMDELQDLL